MLEESENLPEPDVIAREITEDLESALDYCRGLRKRVNSPPPHWGVD